MTDTPLLYHVTAAQHLPSLAQEGLKPRSYWASDEALSAYYADCIRDEGHEPVVLTLPLEVLMRFELMPDRPGLEEPISTVVGMDEDEVWEAWEETGQTWKDCLDLIGSVMCASPIGAEVLVEHNPSLKPAPRKAPRP